MQVVRSVSSVSPKSGEDNEFAEVSGDLSGDFGAKLKLQVPEDILEGDGEEEEEEHIESREEDGEGDEDEDDDFTFACVNPDGSPIAADEAFRDGQIRPIFPLFNRDLLFSDEGYSDGFVSGSCGSSPPSLRPPLKKLFVEEHEEHGDPSEPQGPFCEWNGRTVKDASPEGWRKSNSTGSSKLWRLKDLVLRSNSDGKDAFVFMSSNTRGKSSSSAKAAKPNAKREKGSEDKTKTNAKRETSSSAVASAHERRHVRNRATRGGERHRSYLPYKQVGFFTNVNELSRNLNPF